MADVTLVTGAGGALGAEVARTLSKRGDRVALFDARARKGASNSSRRARRARVSWRATSPTTRPGGKRCRASSASSGRPRRWPPSSRAPGAAGDPCTKSAGRPRDDAWRTMMSANVETVHRSFAPCCRRWSPAERGSIVVVGSRAAVDALDERRLRRLRGLEGGGRGARPGRRGGGARARGPGQRRSSRARWTRPRIVRRCRRSTRRAGSRSRRRPGSSRSS